MIAPSFGFGGREKDQRGHLLLDLVEAVFDSCRHKNDAPGCDCAIFQAAPVKTRTPDPRQGPRFGVSSVSSNQAVLRSLEKSMCRSRGLKLQADFRLNCGFAHSRNSVTVQRSVASAE